MDLESGQPEKELMVKCDVKTRWNTIADMIESVLRIEEAFFSTISDLCQTSFSTEEIEALKEAKDVLNSVKILVEKLCSEKADLLQAEIGFQCMFGTLLQRPRS